jgi:serine/threonine protein phosphatase PrpC
MGENSSGPRLGLWQRLVNWLRRPVPAPTAEPEPDLADTAPLTPESLAHIAAVRVRERLSAGSAQSPGLERETNEDTLFLMYGNSFGEEVVPDFGLFCIADGAGGLGHGELASSIAVRTVVRELLEQGVLAGLAADAEDKDLQLEEIARQAFARANETVREKANGGVTTLTAALLMSHQMTIGHVGDSRAYLVENRVPKQLTRDHSYSQRLVEIGQISPEEALDHPKRNQLWNAVGQGSNLVVEINTYPVPRGGYLLLCSDGLWGEVSMQEVVSVLELHSEPNTACEELVRAANAAGGPDNISALLVAFASL